MVNLSASMSSCSVEVSGAGSFMSAEVLSVYFA